MTTRKDDAWRTNIKTKGSEIQSLIDQVLAKLPSAADPTNRSNFDGLLNSTIIKCKAMHDLFGPNQIPGPLSHLTNELVAWQQNLQQATHLKRIIGLYEPIGQINGDEEEATPSFTSILEKHREDQTLQEFLAELIAALEQLIADGDDILTKQAADELERILVEIRKRKGQSLPDLVPWVEFAIVSTGAVIDLYVGSPIATIAGSAIIAAKKSQTRIQDLFALAHTEFIESLLLKGREKFDSEFGKRLIAASSKTIEIAIESADGLKNLPHPSDGRNLPPAQSDEISE